MKKFPAGYQQGEGATPKRSLHRSFRFALRGLVVAWKLEPNLKRHILLAALVILLALVLRLSALRISILILTITAVIMLELVNSSIEALCDVVHLYYHDKIRDAKDMAAGAVLVVSLGALIIGLVVLAPPLWAVLVR